MLCVLLVAPACAQEGAPFWTQLGGGPGHPNVARHLLPELDVQRTGRLTLDGETLGALYALGLVETAYGLAAIVANYTRGQCELVTFSPDEPDPTRGPPIACAHAHESDEGTGVVGYDVANDAVLVCSLADLDEPLVLSLEARTGEVRWTVTPAQLGAKSPTAPAAPAGIVPGAILPGSRWYCNNVAIDEERSRMIVPAAAIPSRNVFGAIDLASGDVLWTNELEPFNEVGDLQNVTSSNLGAEAYGAVVTRTGIVIGGEVVPAAGQYLFSWYDHDGAFVGTYVGRPRERGPGEAVSNTLGGGVTDGDIAVGFISDELILMDPTRAEPTVRRVEGPHAAGPEPAPNAVGFDLALNAAIFGGIVVMPFRTAAFAYDLRELALVWTWDDPNGYEPSDSIIVPPDDVLILAALGTTARFPDITPPVRDVSLQRLSLSTGEVLHRVDLPPAPGGIYTGHLIPLRDGRVAVFERQGNVTILGTPSVPVPGIALSDPFPDAGETLRLDVEVMPEVVTLLVGWGDSHVDELAPGEPVEHAYAADGRRTLRVTAVYPDNRTATRTLSVDVGGTPPPDTFLARQFSTEKQERTFFLLGLLVTLLGVLLAFLSRRRRHSRIAEDLAILDRIRRQAASDTVRAVEELGAFRARIADDLARGRIDDAQFSTLELAATRLLHLLRQRLLGSLAGRVSVRLEQALDLALQDGRVEASEEATLRALISGESQLATSEREVLERLVATWRARSSA